jgi:hypothetical protein
MPIEEKTTDLTLERVRRMETSIADLRAEFKIMQHKFDAMFDFIRSQGSAANMLLNMYQAQDVRTEQMDKKLDRILTRLDIGGGSN